MPLVRIFHHVDALSADDKQGLASSITNLYVSHGQPAFYVVVLFIPIHLDSFFVGGKLTEKFIRISVDHLAAHFKDSATKKRFSDGFETALAPFIKEKGFDWEVVVQEVPPEMWRENGISPPRPNTPAIKQWFEQNKPEPYDGPSFLEGPFMK